MKIKTKKKLRFPKEPTVLRKNKKKHSQGENGDSSDWAITSLDDMKKQIAAQRASSGGNRPPEVYLRDGEEKRFWFRDDDPVAGIWQYNLRVNGRFTMHTMPSRGDVDYYEKAGLKPTLKFVYEVIDTNGYTDRKGKRHKNIPRFFKVSGKVHQQLEIIKKKRGSLTSFPIDIERSGSDQTTTYGIIPDSPQKMPDNLKKLPRLKKEFRKYYAPLPADQQKAVMNMLDDDEDDDNSPF